MFLRGSTIIQRAFRQMVSGLFLSTDSSKSFTTLATFAHSHRHTHTFIHWRQRLPTRSSGAIQQYLFKESHNISMLSHSYSPSHTDGTAIRSNLGFSWFLPKDSSTCSRSQGTNHQTTCSTHYVCRDRPVITLFMCLIHPSLRLTRN